MDNKMTWKQQMQKPKSKQTTTKERREYRESKKDHGSSPSSQYVKEQSNAVS